MILPANPGAGYRAHKEEIDSIISDVMSSGWYIMGSHSSEFERNFASYIGVENCVGVASGTDAVHFSLRACGISRGDNVLTVSHTAVATVAAIEWLGALPVFVDIVPDTFTIDIEKTEEILSQSSHPIKAVIAVHLYGHPVNIPALKKVTDKYGVILIEDCAQAHGAKMNGKMIGSFGHCSAFSFYPTKNLGAFGDGGAVVCDLQSFADRVNSLKQYGWQKRYISDAKGYNSRLDELQAAILNCKLRWLDKDNDQRRKIAKKYNQAFKELPVEIPVELPDCKHVYHQYVIKSRERNELKEHLNKMDIKTGILYPVPIHKQPAYCHENSLTVPDLKVTERIVDEILSLPVYPELLDSETDTVIDAVKSFFF
ncbi:DegT/DnrJ/EryC1/StrS family aminotransferase [bacterium]|nr:DegT/DnrJ/EryC1/StrS family aminotransferase [bacterium]